MNKRFSVGIYKVWDFFLGVQNLTLHHFRGPFKSLKISALPTFVFLVCFLVRIQTPFVDPKKTCDIKCPARKSSKAQSVLLRKRRSCRFFRPVGIWYIEYREFFGEPVKWKHQKRIVGVVEQQLQDVNLNHQIWWFLRVLIGFDASCSLLHQ